MYNLWVWEHPWRVLATYPTLAEAKMAAKNMADPPDTWMIAKAGSKSDADMRRYFKERFAPTRNVWE